MYKPKSDSMADTEGWKHINWRNAERYVYKLQKRIFAASRCGNINDGHIKYWISIGGDSWVFATRKSLDPTSVKFSLSS
ncbi:reverse transcriptase N-terminal domain-containing protein [Nostoc sp. NMS4]|uniref:reverse transcriptase N-terminal domain-containing protein n=1 Tax=Nostoc sp. NMS4 TaxID=2815390 RepID=UPI0025F161F3|nr:reverse transcriptase N-terminal domain-containing protein [Nostoc sp. NMS4]MBN3921651.1 reverse transcriptase N-terminal domain-containing protein [Nostoc sp. NMS4]